MSPIIYLVGGLEHEWIMTFHSVENVIITDELSMIFQRGRWLNHQISGKNHRSIAGDFPATRPGKRTVCYGKSPCLMGKSTISMAIFNSFLYVYWRLCDC